MTLSILALPFNPPSGGVAETDLREAIAVRFAIRCCNARRHYAPMTGFMFGTVATRDRPTSPESPLQQWLVERLIGTLRCACHDQVVICHEAHLGLLNLRTSTRTNCILLKVV
jgi:hypothetical protein